MTTEATQTGVEVTESWKDRLSAIDAIAGDDQEDAADDQHEGDEDNRASKNMSDDDIRASEEWEKVSDSHELNGDVKFVEDDRVSLKETRKLKVDGQERDATLEEIIAAGTKALQKESAADARLAEATRLLKEAQQAKQIQRPSEEDVAARRASEDAEISQIVRAIQTGTEEEAAQALRYLMERQRTTPEQIATTTEAQVQAILVQRETQSKFATSFPEVVKDQRLYSLAAQEVQRRLDSGEPNSWETYEAAGKEIESWFKIQRPDNSMQAKADKKREVVNLPSAGSKVPTKPDEKPETTQDILNELRKSRKQL